MKNPIVLTAIILLSLFTVYSCNSNANDSANSGPRKVELKKVNEVNRFYVDGEVFHVKGAGIELDKMEALAKSGANSFRTWNTQYGDITGKQILDEAHKHGLMVLMQLEVGRERHGFDYDDEDWVAKQHEELRQQVIELKDHPALLSWGIGNELNLFYSNLKVWDAVDDIARMIHEVDGNHPTTTMFAGISRVEIDSVMSRCSHIDYVSIQSYADIENLQIRLSDANYDGPYLVTEWGATGHWEVGLTEWGAPIEQNSTEKAEAIQRRYEKVIAADTNNCLGSYAFYWGQKQERTPTWYGFFTENGRATEAIDVLYYCWNGEWPENRAPQIISAKIKGNDKSCNAKLVKEGRYQASVSYYDPEGDEVTIIAEIMPESKDVGDGGDLESRPESITEMIEVKGNLIEFNAPVKEGAYRLFVYVNDGYNHVGTVNIPFFVE